MPETVGEGRRLSEEWIEQIGRYGYVGIPLLLILGGLGLPVPEEVPILLAAVLTRQGTMWGPLAFLSCLVGVIAGDFVVYFLGYWYGERVLSLPLIRQFLTRAREAQFKGYFHRHGFKILILGRFTVGFRTAAYLTAGILRLPASKLFVTDLLAASLSTSLMFGLGYLFADWIKAMIAEAQERLAAALAVAIVGFLLLRYIQGRRHAGQLVGPPVADPEDVPVIPPIEPTSEPIADEDTTSIPLDPTPEPRHVPNDPPVSLSLAPTEPASPAPAP